MQHGAENSVCMTLLELSLLQRGTEGLQQESLRQRSSKCRHVAAHRVRASLPACSVIIIVSQSADLSWFEPVSSTLSPSYCQLDCPFECRYYSTALDLIKRAGPEGAGLARDAVTVPSIMYEVRRKTKS